MRGYLNLCKFGLHDSLSEYACIQNTTVSTTVKRLVEDSYRDITISEADYGHLAAEVDAAFDEQSAGRDQEFADLTANRARLEAESDKALGREERTGDSFGLGRECERLG